MGLKRPIKPRPSSQQIKCFFEMKILAMLISLSKLKQSHVTEKLPDSLSGSCALSGNI